MKKRENSFRMDTDRVTGKAVDVGLVRRMLGYVRPYRAHFALAVVAVTGAVLLQLYSVELVKRVIDGPLRDAVTSARGVADYDAILPEIISRSAVILGIVLLIALLEVAQVRLINRVAQRAMRDLRVEVFSHVQRQAMRFFDRNPLGRLVTRVVSDVEALSEILTSGLQALFHDAFLLVGILIWLVVVDWELTLVTFLILPPLVLLTHVFRTWSRRAFRLVRERVAIVNSHLQETIQGIRVIQAFVQQRKMRDGFERENEGLMRAHLSTVHNFAIFFPAMEMLSAIGKAALLWWGGGEILAGHVTFGELTQFLFYLELFVRPIRDLSEKFNVLQGSMASAERLFRLLDREPDLTNPADGWSPDTLEGAIAFEDVTFSYTDGNPVLEDIGFEVRPGESVALVGATGAGKSTVASLVTRLYDVDRGRVLVEGRDVREFDMEALRRGVTVVPQDVFLFAGTVEENLRMGDTRLTREQLLAACTAVGADRMLERMPAGLDSEVGERGSQLSVGERQLLAMARALAQDPAVLILDEATSSVDSETEHLIQTALERLQEGRTTLVIAHRLSTIRKCDRILVFHHGRLREQGTHTELVDQGGIYATLHKLQFAA